MAIERDFNKIKPKFFPTHADFRRWLEINHQKETELWLAYYKLGTGKPSITWSQSVDVALCFGWIDGLRKSINSDAYMIRFTKRNPKSNWSAVNIKKVEELMTQGMMHPIGMASFENRIEIKSKIYSYENAEVMLLPEYEELIKTNKKAWEYYKKLAPTYRKNSAKYIMSAIQKATQIKRLNEFIAESEAGINKWRDHKYKK